MNIDNYKKLHHKNGMTKVIVMTDTQTEMNKENMKGEEKT